MDPKNFWDGPGGPQALLGCLDYPWHNRPLTSNYLQLIENCWDGPLGPAPLKANCERQTLKFNFLTRLLVVLCQSVHEILGSQELILGWAYGLSWPSQLEGIWGKETFIFIFHEI